MSAPVMDRPVTTVKLSAERTTSSAVAPFIAAMLVIVLGAVALVYLRAHQKLGTPGVKVAAMPLTDGKGKPMTKESVPLPENVPGFKSQAIPITEIDLHALPSDTTFGRRLYFTDDGFRAGAGVVLMGSDRTSIHKPEFCIPGNGWHINKKETDEIRINGAHPYNLPVMKWTLTQTVRETTMGGLYIFWFVNDKEITREHSGRMVSIAEDMLTKGVMDRWAYVSFLVMCPPGQEDVAYEKAKKLIAESVPQFQITSGN